MNIKTLLATITLLTVAHPALAHTGDHTLATMSELFPHMLQSPFHIGGIVAVFIAMAGLAKFLKSRKQHR